ncbi:hypothetical protein CEXT_509911 [Caerostris extrusa]|uniref:Uncharacterized protein n=1 Tax=Caerostris extrusa TaxID=172846 RepID=A0AAV4NGC5_CAEEX|nr:hypothetical protein CEXT_509911 [Caerostris extrusa]
MFKSLKQHIRLEAFLYLQDCSSINKYLNTQGKRNLNTEQIRYVGDKKQILHGCWAQAQATALFVSHNQAGSLLCCVPKYTTKSTVTFVYLNVASKSGHS